MYRLAGRFYNSINSALLYDLKSKFSCVVSNSLKRTSKLQSMLSETHQLVFWKANDSKWRVFPKLYAAGSDQNNSNSVLEGEQTKTKSRVTVKLGDSSSIKKVNPSIDDEIILPPVSDEEVEAYIASETGEHRLNDLFYRR